MESKCTTSTQQSSIGRPYILSLPDDTSDADVDSLCRGSINSEIHSKGVDNVYQLETPESCVHHALVGSVPWTDSPITDSLASSIVKDMNEGTVVKSPPLPGASNSFVLYLILYLLSCIV